MGFPRRENESGVTKKWEPTANTKTFHIIPFPEALWNMTDAVHYELLEQRMTITKGVYWQ